MVLRYVSFRITKLLTVFTVSILVCIVTSSYAFSQPNLLNNELVLGVRTIAPPVAGFCYAFRDTLQEYVGQEITVRDVPILNEYKGSFYSRYVGLLKNPFNPAHVDIECGPNSISSGQLINLDSGKPFSEEITFSEPFYTTGIKLLLKKELAQSLKNSTSSGESEKNLKALTIGVLQNTSTLEQLKDTETLYQREPIGSIEDPSDPRRGINSLERALRALDNDGVLDNGKRIDAFASDAIILQSLLKDGVEGSGEEGELIYIQKRSGYSGDYTIFPSEEFPSPDGSTYLPGLKQEDYALAIAKGTDNEAWLSTTIDRSLDNLSTPGSKLRKAKDILKPYEVGQVPLSSSTTSPISFPSTPSSDRWWIPIVVAAVAAFASIVVALLNPQLVSTIVNWIRGGQSRTPRPTEKTITGRVLNARTGAWISGAKVSLEAGGTPPVEYTDSEGIFEFSFRSSSNKIWVRVEADGYKMFDRRIDLSNNGVIADIRLSPHAN